MCARFIRPLSETHCIAAAWMGIATFWLKNQFEWEKKPLTQTVTDARGPTEKEARNVLAAWFIGIRKRTYECATTLNGLLFVCCSRICHRSLFVASCLNITRFFVCLAFKMIISRGQKKSGHFLQLLFRIFARLHLLHSLFHFFCVLGYLFNNTIWYIDPECMRFVWDLTDGYAVDYF